MLDGKFQGTRTWLLGILAALPPGGPDLRYVVYTRDPDAAARLLPAAHFEHRRLPVRNSVLRLLVYWPWAHRAHRLDALVTQYVAPPLDPGRQVVVVHDLLWETHPGLFPAAMRWRLKLLCRLSVRRATRVLAVSRFTAGELTRVYGVPAARLALVRGGRPDVRPPVADATAWATGLRPFVLSVGRLEPRKNIGLLLAASADARARGLRLVVVGREDFRTGGLAADLAAADNVLHLRDVDPDRLAALYRASAALVFPSEAEGFGLPVLEALAYGTPAISSDRTALPEIAGPSALLFDPTSSDAVRTLSDALGRAEDLPRPDPSVADRHLAGFGWAAAAAAFARAVGEAARGR